MARREQVKPQDPIVEASQVELGVLERRKVTIQGEVTVIIDDKKRIIKERDELIARIDTEVEAARKTADETIALLEQGVAAAKERKSQAERDLMASVSGNAKKDLAQAIADRDEAVRLRDEEQVKLVRVREQYIKAQADVTAFETMDKALKESIKKGKDELKELERKNTEVFSEIKRLEKEIPELTREYADLSGNVAAYHADINKFEVTKKEKNAELDGILGQINERNGAFLELTNKIPEVEKKLADKTEEVKKLDAASTERAGNAARLELHVDAKLKHLKELESHFTTERLARHGYKKTEA